MTGCSSQHPLLDRCCPEYSAFRYKPWDSSKEPCSPRWCRPLNWAKLFGQHKKALGAGINRFIRNGAASTAPLLFYTGFTHSCKNGRISQSSLLPFQKKLVCAGKYILFWEWKRNFPPLDNMRQKAGKMLLAAAVAALLLLTSVCGIHLWI